MKIATKDYIIHTVFTTNVLPVISECNTSCIFCSHKQNPDGIEVFRLPKLGLDDFAELIGFLSPDRKIVIGESATRIIEGEPLLHKNFLEILYMIRKKFRRTVIQVTTNGMLLDRFIVNEMAKLGGIELNLSINCVTPEKRKLVFGLKNDDDISEKVSMLKGRIKFAGSCVAIPELLGWDEIEKTIDLLNSCGADNVRLFLRGYTSRAGCDADFYLMFDQACEFVNGIKGKYTVPIVIEPTLIPDLECRIEGVIKGTPACRAGIAAGDIVLEVGGYKPFTRVDAFNKAYRLSDPVLTVKRGNETVNVKLHKGKNCPPGFVMLYDVDICTVDLVEEVIRKHGADEVLFMTSELAYNILKMFFEKYKLKCRYKIISVKNGFFGGTIKCAGLLTIQDILDSAREYLVDNKKPDLIMLPPLMFDHRRRDLLGIGIDEAEKQLGIPVDTV